MKIILLLLLIFSFSLYGQEKITYMNFLYKVEPGDSYASILKIYVKDNSIINKNTPLVEKTMSMNPHISDWSLLNPGDLISIYISEDLMDMNKYNSKQSMVNSKNKEIQKNILIKTATPEGLKGSVFYMSSYGDFSQVADGTSVNYKQNSFLTLGLQSNYFPKNTLYSFSASVYFSIFTVADTIIPPFEVKLPAEVGMNFYADYLWKNQRISFYGGIDYEKFSAFNIEGIFNDQSIYLDRITVVYLTAGISHAFNVYDKPIFVKASMSQSVKSAKISEYSEITKLEPLTGSKLLFYLNYKFNDKIFLHTLLKIHTMSGPSELSSTRLGVGVGYILF